MFCVDAKAVLFQCVGVCVFMCVVLMPEQFCFNVFVCVDVCCIHLCHMCVQMCLAHATRAIW